MSESAPAWVDGLWVLQQWWLPAIAQHQALPVRLSSRAGVRFHLEPKFAPAWVVSCLVGQWWLSAQTTARLQTKHLMREGH